MKSQTKEASKGRQIREETDSAIFLNDVHVGLEMGGTGCKIGIFRDSDKSSELERLYFIDTIKTSKTNAMDTFNEIKDWTL